MQSKNQPIQFFCFLIYIFIDFKFLTYVVFSLLLLFCNVLYINYSSFAWVARQTEQMYVFSVLVNQVRSISTGSVSLVFASKVYCLFTVLWLKRKEHMAVYTGFPKSQAFRFNNILQLFILLQAMRKSKFSNQWRGEKFGNVCLITSLDLSQGGKREECLPLPV